MKQRVQPQVIVLSEIYGKRTFFFVTSIAVSRRREDINRNSPKLPRRVLGLHIDVLDDTERRPRS
jgi:hypothetical protein